MTAAVHDIVALDRDALERVAAGAPSWVLASLNRSPFAVVRRERREGLVCIGIRGGDRAQRHAAEITERDVVRCWSPEMLATAPAPRPHKVFCVIRDVAAAMARFGVAWGPAGAAGFELVSGEPVLHENSDLDVVLRLEPDDARIRRIADALRVLPVRIDAEMCFGDGHGVALEEAARAGTLLVKTPRGPWLRRAAHA
jgi:phosphoribosyl-dephospho-CoA transferase